MIIEHTKEEFIIRIPVNGQIEQMQDLIDYLSYKELTSGFSVKQQEIDELAREINKNWWDKNKEKFSTLMSEL
jgi:hypothetical protein